nr:sugar-binding domain-containing protein [uncultured Pedobacter sp.]
MRFLKLNTFLVLLFMGNFTFAQTNSSREIISFDKDWQFKQADVPEASKANFNDTQWRTLDVPHDWSIEGTYDKLNTSGRGGGYLPTGIGWYRKTFTVDQKQKGKLISIEFDGVMANSEVWINGHLLGKRPFGYSSFAYDLTPYLNFDKSEKNVIAVKADNSVQPASRYYTGAGIYRHVRLVTTNPVHIAHWGVFVKTTQSNQQKADLNIGLNLVNETKTAQSVEVNTNIVDASGKTVKTISAKQNLKAGEKLDINQTVSINQPQLWSVSNPTLYQAITKIMANGKELDQSSTNFGIRSMRFEGATGFWLNDENIKIKGVCLHHDAGGLGSAVPLSAWKKRLSLLKEVGVNAIRVAHNPVAPEFLDLCDEMGFMVMNETFDTWTASKNNGEKGYNLYFNDWWKKDVSDLVLRDRNHPSVILYSVGNEIRDNLDSPEGFKKYKDLQDLIHQLDGTRLVTMALFRPSASKVYTNGFAETMDIVGQNYRENELVAYHEAHPNSKVIGTENGQTLATWLILRDNPYMAGQFLWTGFNYLGEADWPEIANNQGLFDQSGRWKTEGLQRQSWWSNKPLVHLVRREENAGKGDWVANWTPNDFDTYDVANVQVYSNCDEVEVFLNGKSQGVKTKPQNDAPRNWELSFEKGTIKAVGKNGGKVVSQEEFVTAGEPAKIILEADHSTIKPIWDDVVYVTAKVVDENGVICPNAIPLINFTTSTNAEIVAVENGNVLSHEKYKDNKRMAYKGSCDAIIRAKKASGEITITAKADNLKEASLKLVIK